MTCGHGSPFICPVCPPPVQVSFMITKTFPLIRRLIYIEGKTFVITGLASRYAASAESCTVTADTASRLTSPALEFAARSCPACPISTPQSRCMLPAEPGSAVIEPVEARPAIPGR